MSCLDAMNADTNFHHQGKVTMNKDGVWERSVLKKTIMIISILILILFVVFLTLFVNHSCIYEESGYFSSDCISKILWIAILRNVLIILNPITLVLIMLVTLTATLIKKLREKKSLKNDSR